MSNTAKVHGRFWDAMRARFGSRWIENQGGTPTMPWVQLIDRYTPMDLRKALELMGEDVKRVHPPTLPEFEQYLRRAGTKRSDGVDYTRGHWRSIVVATCLRHAALLNLCPLAATDLREMEGRVYEFALRACHELLEWACETERRNGQRTPEMEQHINAELWRALRPFRQDSPPPPRQATVNYRTPAGDEKQLTFNEPSESISEQG